MKLTMLSHASVLLEEGPVAICTDPSFVGDDPIARISPTHWKTCCSWETNLSTRYGSPSRGCCCAWSRLYVFTLLISGPPFTRGQ
jgi:hypothetical protein